MKLGLFGIGLDTYWPQFAGLRDRLAGYQARIAGQLREMGVRIIIAQVNRAEASKEGSFSVQAGRP